MRAVEPVGPRMVRVTLAGPELDGFTLEHPAASVRLLLPLPGEETLVLPRWNGNEFLMADGRRPAIRTFTPRRVDPDALEVDVEIVLHDGGGVASAWARHAEPGRPAAVSGPGRGYVIESDAPAFLLAGDETAVPAISQLLEALPRQARVNVRIEVANPDGRVALPGHPQASVEWCEPAPGASPGVALGAAVRDTDLVAGARVWVAGEAAAVQRIRHHLFDERGLSRSEATVRGYWKRGRSGGADGEG